MQSRKELIKTLIDEMENLRRSMMPQRQKFIPLKFPTPAQGRVLILVADKKRLSVKEISENLNITSSAATQLIDELVQDKLLSRIEDGEDRRKFNIELSPKAAKMIGKFRSHFEKRFDTMTKLLTDKELLTLTELIGKINKSSNP
jgi:DNA-binding MarR family transcriptional regulator